ncbi:MAG: tRNA (adenosine(37)-N6)-threonylcarbamoyltransferase complex dimerization subunit type 1 TsaB, partial [Candidatus Dormiibacterota bacterium]
MSVLAIDTSSRSRVVCVLASVAGELLDAEVIRDEPVAASLPRVLGRMLGRVDTAVVVVTGPGTYTGVRAGMAAALGIAQARELPLHGVGSLEVLA